MFKRDSWLTGVIVGIVLPSLTAILLYFLLPLMTLPFIQPIEKLYLIALIPNIVFLRWFYKTKQYTKSGHGILLITLLLVIAFVYWFKFLG